MNIQQKLVKSNTDKHLIDFELKCLKGFGATSLFKNYLLFLNVEKICVLQSTMTVLRLRSVGFCSVVAYYFFAGIARDANW